MIRLDGRVAIVTGAGQGLGRAHALLLAARGAKVVVNDIGAALDGSASDNGGDSLRPAERVVAEIAAAGGEAVASFDDISRPEGGVALIARAMERFGSADILINNAGILRDRSFAKMTMEDFRAVLDVHLMGAVHCTHAAWPGMLERGFGRVIFTSSAAGLYGNFGQSNYSAAKMALVGLMNTLKAEGRKANVTVKPIAPVAATRMTEKLLPPPMLEKLQPDLIAPLVAWLVSEECSLSGEIVVAGAGHFARAGVVESAGATLTDPSPESIRDAWGRIAAMDGAQGKASAGDALQKLFAAVMG